MDYMWLHRTKGRSIFWIAFTTAIAIHVGAVALATNKSTTSRLESFTPPADIEIVDPATPESAVEELVTPPPLEKTHADEDSFPAKNLKPSPVLQFRKTRGPSVPRDDSLLAFYKNDDDLCAAPCLSVRSAPPTSDRIGHRVAYGRSNIGRCD